MKQIQPPLHQNESLFPTKDNELLIGNINLTQLAQRVGQTPFYAYDRQLLTQRVNKVRHCMPDELKIHYAIKANPMPALVHHMASLVDGFDLASAQEMQTALNTTMAVEHISIAGPGKRSEELSQAIAAGITIHVESINELEKIAQIEQDTGLQAHIAIRINPAFELKASGMKMGGGPKQFGIDEEQLPDVLKRIKTLKLDFIGFHIYSGSQNLKAESIIDAFAELPPDIRRLFGPRLVSAFVGREYGALGRQVADILERAPGDHGDAHDLTVGNLMETEGKEAEAGEEYQALFEDNTIVATDALIELATLELDQDRPPSSHLLMDLGTAANVERGTQRGAALRRLESLWMVKSGNEAGASS